LALGASYATVAELKTRLGNITGTAHDTRLTEALATASRDIDKYCGRQFNDAGSATSRVFYPVDSCLCKVDDFSTTSGLVVKTDSGNDGTYELTWTIATDVQVEPLNGVVDGETGWPYWRIRAVGSLVYPVLSYPNRAPVQVTAQWGWAAVPAGVKEACLILAEETFKLSEAPFGVLGFGAFGPVRVRQNPVAMLKLDPYRRDPVLVA
jgi:hypothetical protein